MSEKITIKKVREYFVEVFAKALDLPTDENHPTHHYKIDYVSGYGGCRIVRVNMPNYREDHPFGSLRHKPAALLDQMRAILDARALVAWEKAAKSTEVERMHEIAKMRLNARHARENAYAHSEEYSPVYSTYTDPTAHGKCQRCGSRTHFLLFRHVSGEARKTMAIEYCSNPRCLNWSEYAPHLREPREVKAMTEADVKRMFYAKDEAEAQRKRPRISTSTGREVES